ncbi:MAG: putative oxidoreductase YcjS [Verrucomicrobiota bacterium]|jgi:predicted dehydrogenase
MTHPIGFAIVGTGMIAEFHARAIAQVPEARLISAYSRGAENCRQFADKVGCQPAASLDELIANPEVQAVCITTPSGAHAEAAVPLLRAGKAVLCEKPLEVTADAVREILEAEKIGGGILAGVFQNRLGRGAQLLKAAVESGRFGQLTLCSAYIKWWRSDEYYTSSAWKGTWKLDGGGALMNQGIHAVDLLTWLVGLPKKVAAFSATLAHPMIQTEDTLSATLEFPNGSLGVIEASTSSFPGSDLRIEIIGNKGSATLVNDKIVRWEFAEPLPGDEEVLRNDAAGKIGGGTADPKAISVEGHRRLIEDLALALRDKRAPMIPGSEAERAVSLVLACYESAKTGRIVELS